MNRKKDKDIFSSICHFIFAVVIAISYNTAAGVFFDPEVFFNPGVSFLTNLDSVIPILELLLAYVAIISGWVGYSRSIKKWPHTDGKLGAFRFSLDIAILFCYFGLLTSASPQNEFQNYFFYWLASLSILFIIWDAIKIKEYYQKGQPRKIAALFRSLGKTIAFSFMIIIALPLMFMILSENTNEVITYDTVYTGILVSTMGVLIVYRYVKWSVYQKQIPSRSK